MEPNPHPANWIAVRIQRKARLTRLVGVGACEGRWVGEPGGRLETDGDASQDALRRVGDGDFVEDPALAGLVEQVADGQQEVPVGAGQSAQEGQALADLHVEPRRASRRCLGPGSDGSGDRTRPRACRCLRSRSPPAPPRRGSRLSGTLGAERSRLTTPSELVAPACPNVYVTWPLTCSPKRRPRLNAHAARLQAAAVEDSRGGRPVPSGTFTSWSRTSRRTRGRAPWSGADT